MPELPEVTTIVNLLKTQILNKEIKDVEIKRTTVMNSPDIFKKSLCGLKINDIKRRGKYLVFSLSQNKFLVSHLAMEGKFFYYQKGDNSASSYARVIFHFKTDDKLIYDDSRMFGKLYFFDEDPYKIPPLSKLGIEPLEPYDEKALFNKITEQKCSIKETLMDQHVIAGIGNIYAVEILFREKIHPLTKSKDISFPVFKKMMETSKEILKQAIKNNGSTIRTYHPGKDMEGNFQHFIKCYGEEICPNCKNKLTKIFIQGRGTTFCYHCQKNVSLPKIKVITSKIGAGKSTALEILKIHNQNVLSCDEFVKNLYEKKEVQNQINYIFKDEIFKNNKMDKNLFLKLFKDIKIQEKFKNYFYPLLEETLYNRLLKYSKNDVVFVEVPLLNKIHIEEYMDKLIFIDVDEKQQLLNLKGRGTKNIDLIRLNSEIDFDSIKKKSNIIIKNNKTLKDFENQITKLI